MVPWNPFLMKKLLKSVVCGTHEQNTEIQFTGEKVKKVTAEKKKKKNFLKRKLHFSMSQFTTSFLFVFMNEWLYPMQLSSYACTSHVTWIA